MSVNGNTHTHDHDRGDDAAAYALGALGPREAADYLRHLTVCTRCREELAAFTRGDGRAGQRCASGARTAGPQTTGDARC